MKLTKGLNPVIRATGVVSAVVIVAGGVTFAALQDSVVLADNSFGTANANLLIWNGSTFAKTAAGFDVNNLVPGEDAFSDPQKFYLKNDSGAPLYVSVKANDTTTGLVYNGVESADDIQFKFTSLNDDCDDAPVTASLTELQDGDVELPCNTLSKDAQGNNTPGSEGTEGNYSVEFGITDATDEGGASVSGLDLTFTGSITAPTHGGSEEE